MVRITLIYYKNLKNKKTQQKVDLKREYSNMFLFFLNCCRLQIIKLKIDRRQ